ncbi:MAG: MBL fold metallo-hydrolase [Eubacteriales bacterium]|nr:MBL fold metallo-hydrolase [Eubacteriales bacterium]
MGRIKKYLSDLYEFASDAWSARVEKNKKKHGERPPERRKNIDTISDREDREVEELLDQLHLPTDGGSGEQKEKTKSVFDEEFDETVYERKAGRQEEDSPRPGKTRGEGNKQERISAAGHAPEGKSGGSFNEKHMKKVLRPVLAAVLILALVLVAAFVVTLRHGSGRGGGASTDAENGDAGTNSKRTVTSSAESGTASVSQTVTDSGTGETWTLTQYPTSDEWQAMIYTITDQEGNLAIVDGGYTQDADQMRSIIAAHGNHVSTWIITHAHPDHCGAFTQIMGNNTDGAITVDRVITPKVNEELYEKTATAVDDIDSYYAFEKVLGTMSNVVYPSEGDTYDILGLKMTVLNTWDSAVEKLSTDLLNAGSLVFRLDGRSTSMLFMADLISTQEMHVVDHYKDLLDTTYVQVAHHGNHGCSTRIYQYMHPVGVFIDAPDVIIDADTYETYNGKMLLEDFEAQGAAIYRLSAAPHSVTLQ